MRVVIALGGNALMRRHEPMDAARQLRNVEVAARAIAQATREHDVVITHGNGLGAADQQHSQGGRGLRG